jgi:glycosyltransferase involved in cell wall biosynthesis
MVTDGVTGLLVPVGAPDRLVGAISRLDRGPDERRRMGLAALEAARSDHDARRNAERVFELLLAQVPATVAGRRSERPELVP